MAHQVVEVEAVGRVTALHQAMSLQAGEQVRGSLRTDSPDRRRRAEIESIGKDGQEAPESLNFRDEQIIAGIEHCLDRFDRVLLITEFHQSSRISLNLQLGMQHQRASRQTQSKWQTTAKQGDLFSLFADG